jgi:DNA mismatch repair protein MutL
MGSIRVLPDLLVNQIAAGEVIERPASVVKELVENAIDAGAKHITVEIMKGGTEKIVITDDGSGMDEMDARLAFERHATSKIANADDLDRINTLGFRGEALSSIASVSQVTLQTKTEKALGGIRLEMEGGKEPVVTSAGCPVGTKFEISNLFFNTPARKKYLKSEQTEYRHVLETVQDIALGHPGVGFRFVSNGRTAFDLMKTKKLQARVGGLFGKSVSDEMVELFYGGSDLKISGWVGKPHTARATRKYQYFIINGRAISDNRLGYAVKEAYSNLIPGSQYPIFVVNITLDPSKVDVNVHPRKLEVRFANPQEMFRVVKSCVAAALAKEHQSGMTQNVPLRDKNLEMPAFLRKEKIVPTEKKKIEFDESGAEYDPSVVEAPSFGFSNSYSGSSTSPTPTTTPNNFFGGSSGAPEPSVFTPTTTSSSTSDALQARKAYLIKKRADRLIAQGKTEEAARLTASIGGTTSTTPEAVSSIFGPSTTPAPTVTQVSDPVATFTESYNEARTTGSLRPVAQINNSYIIAEDDEGVVIIDQHAAHERVMLGKFKANEADREPAKQSLLAPVQLDLDYREKAILEENLDLLRSLGFDISEFGGNTYSVDGVPDFLVNDDITQVMRGFIDDLLNDQSPREAARRHEHILHTLACKAAAKFGKRLSTYEQEALIKSLLQTEGSSACAHGRPTMIRLSFNELEQKFGRKG